MRLIFILTVVLSFLACTTIRETSSFEEQIYRVHMDDVGKVYLQYQDKLVQKDIHNKSITHQFSDKWQNDIIDVDVQNPQEICVLLANGLLYLLDNTLSVVHSLDLQSFGFIEIRHIANALDGTFWISTLRSNTLRKIDVTGDVIQTSSNLYDENIYSDSIQNLIASGRYLLLVGSSYIHVFDKNGTYMSRYQPKHTPVHLQVRGKNVYYTTDGSVQACTLPDFACSVLRDLESNTSRIAALVHENQIVSIDSTGAVFHYSQN